MTLDEAIEHCYERANQDCSDCAKDHQQLTEWLTELKELRVYKKIIQDIKEHKVMIVDVNWHSWYEKYIKNTEYEGI